MKFPISQILLTTL
ncbi:hypothetical protein D039_0577A, partial [Vibrio parahaemolyticus EKP-028]